MKKSKRKTSHSTKSSNKHIIQVSSPLMQAIFCISILFFAAIAVTHYWKYEVFVTVFLLALAFLKKLYAPIAQEFRWYFFIGVIGPLLENVIIWGGAWNYPQHTILFVPLWLPFLWGLAATSAIPIYTAIVERSRL